MERTGVKALGLILARQLAEHVSTPMFVIDTEGTLIYFNEPSEPILGQSFSQTGELSADEWAGLWKPERVATGETIDPAQLPVMVALNAHTPTHGHMRITKPSGDRTVIAVTGLPLFNGPDEFVGAVAIFWEEAES